MGEGIAGWGGTSGGWVNAEMDLSPLVGFSDVKIRFAFCSDPAVCTVDDSSLISMFIDNILIEDGTTNYLVNDADGTAYPAEFTIGVGVWHPDNFNSYLGNSWWSGDPILGGYDNHWLQYLISPGINLSGAVDPVLTFKLNYCVEDPATAAAPYDGWDGCNVWISPDGDNNWVVVDPIFPVYNCQSMYSFGFEWGMGEGIVGWGGTSNGWVNAEMDLSPWAGSSNAKIRFAFCSDPAICTVDDSTLFGMIIEDISIDDGAVNYLENDADSTSYPSGFTIGGGETSIAGNCWIIDDATYHTPSHCATCDHAGHYNLSNAIESPWILIPEGFDSYFTFWVWCDLPDFEGGGGSFLEDYYFVEVSLDGTNWEHATYGFYDYGDLGRPGAASVGWEEYLPGMPFNSNIIMDLSDLAGEDIKIRFRVTTDDNDDGGIGTGLHFDDFTVWTTMQSVEYNLAQYWNLISLPVTPEDNSLLSLFSNVAVAYEFAGGTYVQADSLDNGKAYWIYVPEAETVTVEGMPFTQYSVPVDPPWEMLGSVSTPAIPVVDPGNIVVMYNFDQTYNQIEDFVMEPGFGYWVNMTGDVEEFSLSGDTLGDGSVKFEDAEIVKE